MHRFEITEHLVSKRELVTVYEESALKESLPLLHFMKKGRKILKPIRKFRKRLFKKIRKKFKLIRRILFPVASIQTA